MTPMADFGAKEINLENGKKMRSDVRKSREEKIRTFPSLDSGSVC